ncbi:hypothetical protein [Allobaculum sp. Allo2]|uniref:hypothetical protein n=1 Tax=Allobaculum sp. Allo2 TaxID=2853432 RepID=UPI001F6166E7|nr:hypothetical protein [Allobaculum sp. Allo2]UNT92205.1 hypothetical protein KWG61_08190 [Allobaculum sp. Allo2]
MTAKEVKAAMTDAVEMAKKIETLPADLKTTLDGVITGMKLAQTVRSPDTKKEKRNDSTRALRKEHSSGNQEVLRRSEEPG